MAPGPDWESLPQLLQVKAVGLEVAGFADLGFRWLLFSVVSFLSSSSDALVNSQPPMVSVIGDSFQGVSVDGHHGIH